MPRLPGESASLQGPRAVGRVVQGPRDVGGPAMYRTGRDIVGGANELNAAFEAEQLRIDRTRNEDAHNQLADFTVNQAIGEGGYQTQKGADAVTRPLLKDTLKEFDARVKSQMDGLDNDRQREMFKAHSDAIRARVTSGVLSHQLQEDKVYQGQVNNARVESATNTVSVNPGELQSELVRVRAGIKEYAETLGLGGDDKKTKTIRAEMLREATTPVHAAAIERAINDGRISAARKLLGDARKAGEIDSEVAGKLEAGLKVSSVRADGQAAFDKIRAQYAGDSQGALKAAMAIKNPETRDDATARVRAWNSDHLRIEAQVDKENNDAAWKAAVATEDPWKIDPVLWNSLDGKAQRNILDWIDAKKAADAKPRTTDDISAVNGVESMILAGDITEPEQLELYAPYMTATTYRSLNKLVKDRTEVNPTDVAKSFTLVTGKKIEEDNYDEWRSFQRYISDNVKRPEDLDQWADRWRMEGQTLKDKWGDDPDTLGEAVIEGRQDEFLVEVPAESADTVSSAISVLGRSDVEVQTGPVAQDEFYTKFYLDAQQWLKAHDSAVTPELVAGYAYCRAKGHPLTPKNVQWAANGLVGIK